MATYTFCIATPTLSLSLVDRALATPDTLLVSQSSREGFESSLSIICDKLRVCFAGQVAKSANKMGVFACIHHDLTHSAPPPPPPPPLLHCIQTCPTHSTRNSGGIGSDIIVYVIPLTDAVFSYQCKEYKRDRERERVGGGGGGGLHAWNVNSNIH